MARLLRAAAWPRRERAIRVKWFGPKLLRGNATGCRWLAEDNSPSTAPTTVRSGGQNRAHDAGRKGRDRGQIVTSGS